MRVVCVRACVGWGGGLGFRSRSTCGLEDRDTEAGTYRKQLQQLDPGKEHEGVHLLPTPVEVLYAEGKHAGVCDAHVQAPFQCIYQLTPPPTPGPSSASQHRFLLPRTFVKPTPFTCVEAKALKLRLIWGLSLHPSLAQGGDGR
jgi:hypothetical protein